MKVLVIAVFIGLAFFLGGCKKKTPQVIREQRNMKKVASQAAREKKIITL